jgi:hypothetical protein
LDPEKDRHKLATAIATGLSAVKDEVLSMHQAGQALYANVAPVVRAISPLAEGADRIFAEQALAIGFELCCVMPFSQAEFERDFVPPKALEEDSVNRFRQLLAKSRTRFELDGCRSDEGGAYSACGQVVINQSDLLVVVWDGERKGRRGGTEETLDEARRRGVPVLWIDAHAPHSWRLLGAATPLPQAAAGQRLTPGNSQSLEPLRKCVRDALELPKLDVGPRASAHASPDRTAEDPRGNLERFYQEHQLRINVAVVWKAFRDLVADGKLPRVRFSVTPFEEDLEKEWPSNPSSPLGKLVDCLRPFYAWPDKLAVICADCYRSAFLLSFLLAATAVGMALLPAGACLSRGHWADATCTWIELAAIIAILALLFQGRRRRWHERWLEYRLTAELIRHLRLTAPLGGARPFPQIPAHWAAYGQPGATWMAWYVRAVERALGLPCVSVNRAHLVACLSHLAALLAGQIEYHKTNAARCRRVEERLHFWGIALLGLTLICCGLHFLSTLWRVPKEPNVYQEWLLALLTFLCGFAPAIGAALSGIVNQGEFRRIARRSEAMQAQLKMSLTTTETLLDELNAAPSQSQKQFSRTVAVVAGHAAGLLVNEVLDWRVVFLDRPLSPPV